MTYILLVLKSKLFWAGFILATAIWSPFIAVGFPLLAMGIMTSRAR